MMSSAVIGDHIYKKLPWYKRLLSRIFKEDYPDNDCGKWTC